VMRAVCDLYVRVWL